jgi:hypothetical protein
MAPQVERKLENVTPLRDVSYGARPSRLRLLAPLRYLAISSPEKTRYDFYYPLGFGVAAWIVYWALTPDIPLFGDGGLLRFARDLLIMAVPFLFSALAVVATGLPGPHFEERLRGVNLVMDGRPLTLRKFIAYLLGYLSFLGSVELGAVVLAQLVHSDVAKWASVHGTWVKIAVEGTGTLAFSILSSALVVTVLWSLYFLTDVANNTDA